MHLLSFLNKLDFKKGEGQALNNRGVVETIDGKYDEAIQILRKSTWLFEFPWVTKKASLPFTIILEIFSEELGDHVTQLLKIYKNSLRIAGIFKRYASESQG